MSQDPDRGYNAWNKKRQQAIERGEDPNSELLAKIEARQPDSCIERAWRKLTGKKKTKKEEREAKEAKERARTEGRAASSSSEIQNHGTPEAFVGLEKGKKDDEVIR